MSTLDRFVGANRIASLRFNTWFPGRAHGLDSFDGLARGYLKPGMSIVDIGGGKHPFVPLERKRELRLAVTGVDISAAELAAAPAGSYDRTVVSDCASMDEVSDESIDLVYSRTVAEHVRNPGRMFEHTYRV